MQVETIAIFFQFDDSVSDFLSSLSVEEEGGTVSVRVGGEVTGTV